MGIIEEEAPGRDQSELEISNDISKDELKDYDAPYRPDVIRVGNQVYGQYDDPRFPEYNRLMKPLNDKRLQKEREAKLQLVPTQISNFSINR